jgi:hypothetical protein
VRCLHAACALFRSIDVTLRSARDSRQPGDVERVTRLATGTAHREAQGIAQRTDQHGLCELVPRGVEDVAAMRTRLSGSGVTTVSTAMVTELTRIALSGAWHIATASLRVLPWAPSAGAERLRRFGIRRANVHGTGNVDGNRIASKISAGAEWNS